MDDEVKYKFGSYIDPVRYHLAMRNIVFNKPNDSESESDIYYGV